MSRKLAESERLARYLADDDRRRKERAAYLKTNWERERHKKMVEDLFFKDEGAATLRDAVLFLLNEVPDK